MKWTPLFKNTSIQTLMVVAFAFLFQDVVPLSMATIFYTISHLLKDLLLFFLPFAICIYIATTLLHFEKKGVVVLISLLLFEALSNTSASLAAYGFSFLGADLFTQSGVVKEAPSLTPLFSLGALRPSFWRVEYGSLAGVALGLLLPYFPSSTLAKSLRKAKMLTDAVLSKGFSKLIPLLVLGFFFNLTRTWSLDMFVMMGGKAILILALGVSLYVVCIYVLAAGTFSKAFTYLKNALPAGITAFTSMSSVATMPVTIQCASKNLKNPSFASMIIPATTNIQQVGDCFMNVFLCCVILHFFGQGIPDLVTFSKFLAVFVLARYTTAAVVGGAVFIMLPIFQTYLGFTPEMTALFLAFNMILDPIVTTSNVMGNIGLCSLFEKFLSWQGFIPEKEEHKDALTHSYQKAS